MRVIGIQGKWEQELLLLLLMILQYKKIAQIYQTLDIVYWNLKATSASSLRGTRELTN